MGGVENSTRRCGVTLDRRRARLRASGEKSERPATRAATGVRREAGRQGWRRSKPLPRAAHLVAPSVILLFVWMIVPLVMTLYFSLLRYNLLHPDNDGFVGCRTTRPSSPTRIFSTALVNTLILVVSVLVITVVGGILLALLIDQPIFGQGIVRLLVIAPFFVMPTVSALVWKNMMMNPITACSPGSRESLGFDPVDWFTDYRCSR